jgi:hypothetical protein
MTLREALQLVREKYLEEEKGVTTGETARRYQSACDMYPAMMKAAHQLWARELAKGLP